MHTLIKKRTLFLLVLFLLVVGGMFILPKQNAQQEDENEPQTQAMPFFDDTLPPKASNEILLPHGTNTILVNGNPSLVPEPSTRGESMIDEIDAEANPIIQAVFTDVIQDSKRDFFGPYQILGDQEKDELLQFAFLRYHRLGDDTDGLFTVQAGEVTAEMQPNYKFKTTLRFEPPHRIQGFPWCYLLLWDPGKRMQYRCFDNTAPQVQKNTWLRYQKHEYHFDIPSETTKEFIFSHSCPPNHVFDDECGAYTEEWRDPQEWMCDGPRGIPIEDEILNDPSWKPFLDSVIARKKETEQFLGACVWRDEQEHRFVFLRTHHDPGKELRIQVGEFDAQQKRISKTITYYQQVDLCTIDQWIPRVLLRYTCSGQPMAITKDRIPTYEYQWDLTLNSLTQRTCRGGNVFVGQERECTQRTPIRE